MGHFAKVVDGVVTQVIVAEPDFFEVFTDTTPGEWIQTSYNTIGGVHLGEDGKPDGGTPLRKNFAGIGYTYDKDRDAFIAPKPYNSWLLDEESCLWKAPIEKPTSENGEKYVWDESVQNWIVESVKESA